MFQKLQRQLQWRADLLLAGRLEDLSREYYYPLAVYLEDELSVIHSPEAFIEMMDGVRNAMLERGVGESRVEVVAIDIPSGQRQRVWVKWHEVSPIPEQNRVAEAICYLRNTGSGLKTEMMDFTSHCIPEVKLMRARQLRHLTA